MKPVPIDPQLFVGNRSRLKALMHRNGLAVLNANDTQPTNADGTFHFFQNADLFYLTGIRQEQSILILAPDAFDENLREILFIREPNALLRTWEGHKLSREEATAISGIKTIKWLSDFQTVLHQLMCEGEHVYLNTNEHTRAVIEVQTRDARFIAECQRRYPLHQYHRLARLMHQLRTVKQPEEVRLIQQACDITGAGFERVARFVKPGVNEAEIEAEFAHEFIRNRAVFAYEPIIASGANSCILHYNTNDQPCKDGEVVLLDVAAARGGYMSDLTRTLPVNGRFTRRQRQVYNAVLRVLRETASRMKPGVFIRDLRAQTEELTARELVDLKLLKSSDLKPKPGKEPGVRKYFMHGVAHHIGLDVHDVGFMNQPVQAGCVLTCEPGIYIEAEGFGVRLENDILVTADGPVDLMSKIPIETDEIEALMRRRR